MKKTLDLISKFCLLYFLFLVQIHSAKAETKPELSNKQISSVTIPTDVSCNSSASMVSPTTCLLTRTEKY